MGLDKKDFERWVLDPTLRYLDPEVPYTENAKALVWETIWHESDELTYLSQKLGGPALGLCQMERPTFDWLTRQWLPNNNANLWVKVNTFKPCFEDITWNLKLCVAMCRIRYLPDPHQIPNTIEARAAMWSRVYQTTNDPIKTRQYIEDAKELYGIRN